MESERIVYSIAEQDPSQRSYGSMREVFTGSLFTSPANGNGNPVNLSDRTL